MNTEAMLGTWAGTAANDNGFEIDVTLSLTGPFEVGATCGSFAIPTNPCSGTFRLLSIRGETLDLQAENKQGICGDAASDSVELLSDGTLLYISKGDGWEARGILQHTSTAMTTDDQSTMEQQLLQYYLLLTTPVPEGGAEWNLSPEYHYLFGFAVRDFLRRSYTLFHGIQVCNVGIGVGDWDDFLGYWLKDWGTLTSVDIVDELCTLFAYRQQRERHPNPSRVVNEDILHTSLPHAGFDLVTIIGSTPQETGNPKGALDRCFDLVKPGGHLLYMGTTEIAPASWFAQYLQPTAYVIERQELFDYFPQMVGHAFLVRKPMHEPNQGADEARRSRFEETFAAIQAASISASRERSEEDLNTLFKKASKAPRGE
jgi:SAM-dependent methyltransferase